MPMPLDCCFNIVISFNKFKRNTVACKSIELLRCILYTIISKCMLHKKNSGKFVNPYYRVLCYATNATVVILICGFLMYPTTPINILRYNKLILQSRTCWTHKKHV